MTMLGAECSACCQDPCVCGAPGEYAPALTPSEEDQGLVWLEFSSCIGSGAAGTVAGPTAVSPCEYEPGAITGVTLTNGGSGYARLGRVEPTITASVSGGTGATFSVTLSEGSEYLGDGCMEVPYWSVASVSVTAGGSGYTDGTAVTFSAATGDTTVHAAAGRAYVEIDEPTGENFDIDSSGTGAVLAAVWSALTEDDWADVRTPNPCPAPEKKTYELSSVTVTSGGSGYAQYDRIYISFPTTADGGVVDQAYIDVESVDGNGAIQSVFVSPDDGNFVEGPGGIYIGSLTDELAEVVVNSCVANGVGQYYREDASEPPYVAAVMVAVNQADPSDGTGAVVTATVEDDTSSANFGKVVSLTLDSGGTGYVAAPLQCGVLDRVYVTFKGETTGIPIPSAPAIPLICNNGLIDGETCGSSEDPGSGRPPIEATLGNTGSYTVVRYTIANCGCGGKLLLTMRYDTFGETCVGSAAAGDDPYDDTVSRADYVRQHYLCARFEMDESGCPVGDAIEITFEKIWEQEPADLENLLNAEGDPLNLTCLSEDFPTISFMP
jgi:hypothetical protein